jgi:hypothetical protein
MKPGNAEYRRKLSPGALEMEYQVKTKTTPTFYFIGVTTTKSSIMKVFPLWAKELGHPEVVIEGVDLLIHDKPEAYRQAVAQIKYDANSLGSLVTTHKIDLLTAARDMFEYLDTMRYCAMKFHPFPRKMAIWKDTPRIPSPPGSVWMTLLDLAISGALAGKCCATAQEVQVWLPLFI